LQARLGSIRIAVTAVTGLELDTETRNEMLTSASEEAVRASAELAGIGALAELAISDSPMTTCDLDTALRSGVDAAKLAGLDIDARGNAGNAFAREDRLGAVFAALIRIVGGAGKSVDITATVCDGRAVVAITRRADADTEAVPPLVDYLAAAIGATRDGAAHGLSFSFEAAS
jgi:hypothetical protein